MQRECIKFEFFIQNFQKRFTSILHLFIRDRCFTTSRHYRLKQNKTTTHYTHSDKQTGSRKCQHRPLLILNFTVENFLFDWSVYYVWWTAVGIVQRCKLQLYSETFKINKIFHLTTDIKHFLRINLKLQMM